MYMATTGATDISHVEAGELAVVLKRVVERTFQAASGCLTVDVSEGGIEGCVFFGCG